MISGFKKTIPNMMKASAAILAIFWPMMAEASYLELGPGGVLAIGTSVEDARMLWAAIIRVGLGIVVLFLVFRMLTDSYALHMTSNADVESTTVDSLWSVGKAIAFMIVIFAVAPYAINTFFDFINGGLAVNFG